MRILKRALLVLAGLAVLAVAVVAVGTLGSLDWERQHAARTRALPPFSPSAADGLVRIEANGMEFRARVAGLSSSGPAVMLLHGFPDTSAMWAPLISVLAAAGYRVVAIDQRGYSPGARPDGVENYLVPELISDVLAVADAVGFERFHLIGHDWGCVVGWGVAIQRPSRLRSFTGRSIPHPGTLLANVARDPPTYIRIFTAPLPPEAMLSFNGMQRLRAIYADRPPEQVEEYIAVFAEPGALTAALNWYRGLMAGIDQGGQISGPVSVPTRFIYGSRELWVTPEALAQQRELVHATYDELELDAGHSLLLERPDETIAPILEHLRRTDREESSQGPPAAADPASP